MVNALGHLLPIAVAAAVSSVPITVMIVMLLSPKRRETAIPYLLGWVLGCALVVSIATLAAQTLPEPRLRQKDVVTAVLTMLIGLVLIALGVRAWLHRQVEEKAEGSSMLERIGAVESFGAGRSLGIGLALNVRPKGLMLAAAAGIALHANSLELPAAALMVTVYVVVATSTVTIPILLTLRSPERMEARLTAARELMLRNGNVVSAVVLFMIGVVLIGAGLTFL